MKFQYKNKLISSFQLFLEHEILKKGEAFVNTTVTFYPTKQLFNNFFTYACPFKPLVADASISGINQVSGVYFGDSFVSLGVSGLTGINFQEGQVYTTGLINETITGAISIQELPIQVTHKPDEEILFETKFELRPKVTRPLTTGLAPNVMTYPIMFIKSDTSENQPIAFGGMDDTQTDIRGIIIADSQFNLDAILSICEDTARKYVPLLDIAEMPFNVLGSYQNGTGYDYDASVNGKVANGTAFFIENVFTKKFSSQNMVTEEIKRINPNVFVGLVDFETSHYRFPHQN